MTVNAGTSDFFSPPFFAALDDEARDLIGNASSDNSGHGVNDPRDPDQRRRWPLLLAVMLAAAFALTISSINIASSRVVYVVNGSTELLRVIIDDSEEFEISGISHTEVTLSEGKHRWKISHPEAAVAEGDFEFSTGFLKRLNSSPMFILDPARTAVTVWEKARYAAETPETEMAHRLYMGDTFYAFDDIDFRFKPFPGTIKASGSSATRTRVEPILLQPSQVIGYVANEISSEQQLEFCERHLLLTPRDDGLISAYGRYSVQASAYERLYQFMKDGCSRRPLEISWHRRYQSAALRVDKTDELFAEYDELAKQLPDNGAALYLRGRIEPHGPLSEEYFNRSIAADPSNPFPYYAKCHRLMSLGRFDEAFDAASKASELNPDHQEMKNILHRARLALGQFEELEREQRKLISEESIEATAHFRLLGILAAQDRFAEMRQAHDEFVLAVNNEIPLDPHDLVVSSARFLAYCNRDYEKMMELTLKLRNPLSRSNLMLEALVSRGMHEELSRSDLIQRPPEQRGFVRLQIAMMHELEGNSDASRLSLAQALEDFRNGTPETQRIAEAVGEFDGPNIYEDLNAISMSAGERVLVNIAVASRTHGETRVKFLDSCRVLNFSPGFPNHFIAQLIEQFDEGPPSNP